MKEVPQSTEYDIEVEVEQEGGGEAKGDPSVKCADCVPTWS